MITQLDVLYCELCDKDTHQEITTDYNERDSNSERRLCLRCGGSYYGMTSKWVAKEGNMAEVVEEKDTLLKDKRAVGVIIARLQVPHLTNSHKQLISTVVNRHDRSILFLGCTRDNKITPSNPFPFNFRKEMVMSETAFKYKFKHFDVFPLRDFQDNTKWVDTLDNTIGALLSPKETAVLYGGRDSFIPYYHKGNGKHETLELAPQDYDSGTELRLQSSIHCPIYTKEAANAILWTLSQIM